MARIEHILWGTPKGSNVPIDEKVLYTQARTMEDIDAVKEVAAKNGWHSFRVQVLDLEVAPGFGFITR